MKGTDKYNHKEIEKKWRDKWEEEKIYQPDLKTAKKPFYNLMMFPYPSAEGLHVGNVYAFTGVDIYGRFKRMQANDVFEPIGLDGFGIHSENYAIKVGRTPQEHAEVTEKNFYKQLHLIGNGFDWSKKVETYDSKYYKWTQWLFVQLFKAGLAYRAKAPVNFCPSCKTVLANEQVIDQRCERCGTIVEKRNLEQWFFKITDYAERLLTNIESLNWTEKVKIAQRNWIGKKEGIEIKYQISNIKYQIKVFTTRPDTNFGATFIVIAPEHDFVRKIIDGEIKVADQRIPHIKRYVKESLRKTEQDRIAEGKKKTGVFTGLYAINNLNKREMPIWISDFVIGSYGTGAVVGVPGHDLRDFQFAKEFGLPIIRVVTGRNNDNSEIITEEQVQEEQGVIINSGFLDGVEIKLAIGKMMDYLEKKGWGKRVVTYHLRDWLISRQRYWGPPIPMVFCSTCYQKGLSWFNVSPEKKRGIGMTNDKFQMTNKKIGNSENEMHGWFPVPENELPLILPHLDNWRPTGTGKAPLAQLKDWVNIKCPNCGGPAERETDTSDNFLDSSWYFFRYISPDLESIAFDTEIAKKWLPVTSYIGGAEHSVLHLLYSRFVTMVLKDLGYIEFEEPFSRFFAHGLIIKDGAKMSKSKGNVVIPDEYISKYGADTLRAYLAFLGPFDQGGDFRDSGIEGMNRFLKRVWNLLGKYQISNIKYQISNEELFQMHKAIKKVTEELESLKYNTSIAAIMEYYNFLSDKETLKAEEIKTFLRLLAPFAPHITEEIWQSKFANDNKDTKEFRSIHREKWPTFNNEVLKEQEMTIIVQVNGKVRENIRLKIEDLRLKNIVEDRAKDLDKVKKHLEGKDVKNVIYIEGKVINFVTNN